MRRSIRAGFVLIAAMALALGVHKAPAADSDQTALIAKAYEYGFPLFEHARLVYLYSYDSGNPQRVPVNSFGHRLQLVDHTARAVTTIGQADLTPWGRRGAGFDFPPAVAYSHARFIRTCALRSSKKFCCWQESLAPCGTVKRFE